MNCLYLLVLLYCCGRNGNGGMRLRTAYGNGCGNTATPVSAVTNGCGCGNGVTSAPAATATNGCGCGCADPVPEMTQPVTMGYAAYQKGCGCKD